MLKLQDKQVEAELVAMEAENVVVNAAATEAYMESSNEIQDETSSQGSFVDATQMQDDSAEDIDGT